MKLKNILLVTAFALIATTASPAATISATLASIYPTSTTQGTFTGGPLSSVYSGALTFTSNSVGEFLAFCVEPEQSISIGQTITYSVSSPNQVELAQVMAVYVASSRDALNSQGAQWAIWELLNDSTIDLSAGNVRLASGAVKNMTQSYLNTYSSYAPLENVLRLSSSNRQDMIAIIPEPTVTLLGSIGLFGLIRRRRIK